MLPIEGQPILTAAQMRAAEERAAPTPELMYGLMERAGHGVAEVVRRLAEGAEVLILCGPGNNGGDGYVAARLLREWGHPVRVAALGEPTTDLAQRARAAWTGPVEPLLAMRVDIDEHSLVVVDCVFGTGLSRPMDRPLAELIADLMFYAKLSIAVDLPSGVDADTGASPPCYNLPLASVTLALGAVKPAHVLTPGALLCGDVRLLELGLNLTVLPQHGDGVVEPPSLRPPSANDHKYSRGMVAVVAGAMPGAASLAITAAMRAGAGYGLLLADRNDVGLPHAVVQRNWSVEALARALNGKSNAVVVIGPGLGRGEEARAKLDAALACDCPLVIDGDALHLLDEADFDCFRNRGDAPRDRRIVLTPHGGEFASLFGKPEGSKIDAARAAARRSGAIVAFKGYDTVVAHPDGSTNTLAGATPWLSTAGTGDVLAGTIAGVWQAAGSDPVEAGVWLHAEAARRCGASFIADDLAHALTAARASLSS